MSGKTVDEMLDMENFRQRAEALQLKNTEKLSGGSLEIDDESEKEDAGSAAAASVTATVWENLNPKQKSKVSETYQDARRHVAAGIRLLDASEKDILICCFGCWRCGGLGCIGL